MNTGTMVAERVRPAELLSLLYRQMRTLAGPRVDIDDLVQAAAERALRALDRFEGRCSLSTFTYQISYRTLIDHERWYRRFRRRFGQVQGSLTRTVAVISYYPP